MATHCSSSMTDHVVYLGLGSNLGDKERNIHEAVKQIGELIGTVECLSALLVTEPWGFESANQFVNAVCRCRTTCSPREVLRLTQQIERAMGRRKRRKVTSAHRTYHDRIIDIDILLYDDLTVDEPGLKIPHPLMQQRDFVMVPLREIYDS